MRLVRVLLLAFFVVAGCKKKDPVNLPEAALLVFPNKNSECTVGNDISATTREVDFKWQKATYATSYELRVTNIDANSTQTISTPALSARLPILKGATFSWVVLSKNEQVTNKVSSAAWQFYNAGSETSRPPFSAEIIAPELGKSLFKDINNEVTLSWLGSDVDNDIVEYDIYFDTVSPPISVLASLGADVTEQKVSVEANTVYYWKVVTKDGDNHTSDSGIFDFRIY
ncbi:hypothetical protein JQC67_05435 [Aurantibacter crassamenti]|uniref:hypothetical protein n=1 Tax=Aurantibacter crassamenti TaxID=1837375 RepID=UPI00193A2770|nr:hypothetical protein [Aurantibacter crassamenti]MBM1105580.1 hypothetical protein [Aurantibacter crassamenti]